MEPKINVMIADDQNLFAKLLKASLYFEPRFNIVSIVYDGNQVIEQLQSVNVDVLLLDINMPKMDGIQVIKVIRDKYPDMKIIVLSNLTDSYIIVNAIQLGANGYLTKLAECEEVRDAILLAVKGDRYICRTSYQNLLNGIAGHQLIPDLNSVISVRENNTGRNDNIPAVHHNETNLDCLTSREKEIFNLIVNGETTKSISDKLFISTRTVETHRKNILQKLGVKNSFSLLKLAAESNNI